MGDAAGNFYGRNERRGPRAYRGAGCQRNQLPRSRSAFKKGDTIKGLTTAAGFWVTTAIGLSIGSGMYYTGIFTTVLVIVIQVIFHRVHIGAIPPHIQ